MVLPMELRRVLLCVCETRNLDDILFMFSCFLLLLLRPPNMLRREDPVEALRFRTLIAGWDSLVLVSLNEPLRFSVCWTCAALIITDWAVCSMSIAS